MVNIKSGPLLDENDRIKEIKVKNILQKGRRYFGSSGASLTHQISDPVYADKGINATLAAVGLKGEHKTSKDLKAWAKTKENVVVIDSVHLKGQGADEELNEETGVLDGGDTDHVIIIGRNVIILDSKNWKAGKKYTVNEKGVVLRSGKDFPGGRLHTVQALYLWRKYLAPLDVSVSAIVSVVADKIFIQRDKNWWSQPYRLVRSEDLIEFLDKVYNVLDNKEDIYSNIVTTIVSNAIKPYDRQAALLGPLKYTLLQKDKKQRLNNK